MVLFNFFNTLVKQKEDNLISPFFYYIVELNIIQGC